MELIDSIESVPATQPQRIIPSVYLAFAIPLPLHVYLVELKIVSGDFEHFSFKSVSHLSSYFGRQLTNDEQIWVLNFRYAMYTHVWYCGVCSGKLCAPISLSHIIYQQHTSTNS